MIDWTRVRQLQDEVGAEDFDEVIDLFLEEVGTAIARLEVLQDRSKLGDDLHFLKGSALSLGFKEFSDLCHDGETTSANGCPDSVDVTALIECYHSSKGVFLAEYEHKLVA